MKRSKVIKRVMGIVVFLCLFYFGYSKITRLMIIKTGRSDTISTFYDQKRNSCDVLFVGSSHAYRAFSPMELWGETGITSYTLATPAQPMAASYYLVREGIRTQHPKLIVLEMYGFRYKDDFREGNLHRALDGVPLGRTKWDLYTQYLKEKTGWENGLTYLFPIMLYHQRWSSLGEKDYDPQSAFLRGYLYSTKVEEQKAPGIVEGRKKVPEDILIMFDKIVEECEKSDTALLLVAAPLAKAKKNTKSIQKLHTAAEYATEKGITSIILNDYVDEIGIDFKTDFYELAHLNASGGKKVTNYIGKYISEHYELTDHRGDSAYADWEADYREYQEFVVSRSSEAGEDVDE